MFVLLDPQCSEQEFTLLCILPMRGDFNSVNECRSSDIAWTPAENVINYFVIICD